AVLIAGAERDAVLGQLADAAGAVQAEAHAGLGHGGLALLVVAAETRAAGRRLADLAVAVVAAQIALGDVAVVVDAALLRAGVGAETQTAGDARRALLAAAANESEDNERRQRGNLY